MPRCAQSVLHVKCRYKTVASCNKHNKGFGADEMKGSIGHDYNAQIIDLLTTVTNYSSFAVGGAWPDRPPTVEVSQHAAGDQVVAYAQSCPPHGYG